MIRRVIGISKGGLLVEAPKSYDFKAITAEDILNDGAIRSVEHSLFEETGLFCLDSIEEICQVELSVSDLATMSPSEVGRGQYKGQIGYKIANGDLSPQEAASYLRLDSPGKDPYPKGT